MAVMLYANDDAYYYCYVFSWFVLLLLRCRMVPPRLLETSRGSWSLNQTTPCSGSSTWRSSYLSLMSRYEAGIASVHYIPVSFLRVLSIFYSVLFRESFEVSVWGVSLEQRVKGVTFFFQSIKMDFWWHGACTFVINAIFAPLFWEYTFCLI